MSPKIHIVLLLTFTLSCKCEMRANYGNFQNKSGQKWEKDGTLEYSGYSGTLSRNNGVSGSVEINCRTEFTDEIIQLIIDYSLWRNINMVFFVAQEFHSACNIKAIRQNLDCFHANGLFIAIENTIHKLNDSHHLTKKALVVTFISADTDIENYSQQLNLYTTYSYHFKLLQIYDRKYTSDVYEEKIFNKLKSSTLMLSIDFLIVVATSNYSKVHNIRLLDQCKRRSVYSKDMDRTPVETLLPFNNTLNENTTAKVTFNYLCDEQLDLLPKSFCFLQMYKIRKTGNTSLVVRPLGFWSYEKGTEKVKPYQPPESRIDFQGFPLIFGKKGIVKDMNVVADVSVIEDDTDDENMDKIADCMAGFLNAQQKVLTYQTLGLKSVTGNWTGLLGAVISQEVDIGIDSVIKVPERYNEMAFTQDIMTSVRNIYLKPEQSHTARDIFSAPFGFEMIMCVLGTGIIFAIAMTCYLITHCKDRVQTDSRFISVLSSSSDALLWMTGIFAMQGTSVQPRTYSGNIIIVISLVFALIIYNAYSAFITSMLSVKLTKIRTVQDLLESDYDIEYTKNSQDEIFLRSMNETQLNQIYLRGYLHNSINNITEGLLKAVKGNYGFFATGNQARKQFLKISGYKCKYEIMEISVPSTINAVAFPIAKNSPYRKAINLCLIRMFEAGIHQYIISLVSPKLPRCDHGTTYQSVRLMDLTTCYTLLGLGFAACILTILGECLWRNRSRLHRIIQKHAIARGFTNK